MVRRAGIPVLCFWLAALSIVPGAAVLDGGPSGLWQKTVSGSSAGLDLTAFLPRAGEASGWSPKDEPLVYRGDDLFTYIDGGADIYNEYGFRQVVVQDYEDTSQRTLTLEVFEMTDTAAAFGMFTFKASARGTEAALGDGGRLEDYYLNFWKGPVLVTVTGFDDSPESIAGIRRVAQAADRKIRLHGEKPPLAAAFPADWSARGGLKYLRGPLGLRNLQPVFARRAIRFQEGVAGWPADGVLAAMLRGGSVSDTQTALADAEKLFSSGAPFSGYQSGDGRFAARDAKGNFIEGRLLDGGLAILITKGPSSGAEEIWERLGAAFSRQPH